jgi:hypothetical protein
MNALSPQLSKKTHIKVASILWRVYLATVVSAESTEEVGLTTHQRWFVQKGSLIIPLSFPLNSISFSDFRNRLVATDATGDAINDFQDGELDSLPADSLGSESEAQPLRELITLESNDLIESSKIFQNDVLFYEIIGSVQELLRIFGDHYMVQSLHPSLIRHMRRKIKWLEPITYWPDRKKRTETVGITMALFTHDAENRELVRNVIKLLTHKPYKFFPNSYLFDNLKTDRTKEIPGAMLHDSAIRVFSPR